MNKNILILVLIIISLGLLTLLVKQTNFLPQIDNETPVKNMTQEILNNENEAEVPVVKTSNSLDLSNQNLTRLPDSLFSSTNLEELNISNNKLTGALPGEIRHLKNLKILNISNNMMTGIPAEVGQLSKLEILDLSNNQFTGLPYELGNLKSLKILKLSGNNYSQQDLETIRKSLPSDTEIVL